MTVPSNSPKYICAKCRNKVEPDVLETIFQNELKGLFSSPEDLAKLFERADMVIKEKQELLEQLENEKGRVERHKEKVKESYFSEEITVKTFGAEFRPLEERLEAIKAQMPELQGEIDFLKIKHLSSEEVIREAKDLFSRWNVLLFAEKRRIIENITNGISVGKDDITLNLAYVPSASELMAEKQQNVRGSWRPPS